MSKSANHLIVRDIKKQVIFIIHLYKAVNKLEQNKAMNRKLS